jgi:hypothetical protein
VSKKLTDEQKAFFMDMESLFNHPGWARLRQGWQTEFEAIPQASFYNAKSMDDMLADRTRMRLLHELIELPAQIERMKQEILNDEADPV